MLCRACNSEKQADDFYVGVASRCKDCHKAAMKVRSLTNPRVQEYAKPLEVKWLRAKCHHRVHATFPELGGHFQAAE